MPPAIKRYRNQYVAVRKQASDFPVKELRHRWCKNKLATELDLLQNHVDRKGVTHRGARNVEGRGPGDTGTTRLGVAVRGIQGLAAATTVMIIYRQYAFALCANPCAAFIAAAQNTQAWKELP